MKENYIKWLEKKIEHNKVLMDNYDCDFNHFLKDDSDIMQGIADFLRGKEVVDEPLYYALIKGHELSSDESKYWNSEAYDSGHLFIGRKGPRARCVNKMSKENWNRLGINESNADFVGVVE